MDQQGSPAFFCTTGLGQIHYIDKNTKKPGDVYARCMQSPNTMMEIMHGSPYIIVCPRFFTRGVPAVPPPHTCLEVNRFKTQFLGNGELAIAYQMWVLLEEIAHYYIYMTTGSELDIYNVNTCAQLNGKDSSQNAHNYLYYVASRFYLVLSTVSDH